MLNPSLRRRTLLQVGAAALGLNLVPPGTSSAQGPCRITILGDSLTAGYGVPLDVAFPAVLEAELRMRGIDCSVADAGVSGDTSAGGRARLAWVLAERPSHLIVELGGNDGLRALPVEQLEDNLRAIIRTAQAAGVEVLLAGMLAPPNHGRDYTEAFAAIYPRLAKRYKTGFYPFFLDGAITDKKLMQPDGIHPNALGVRRIVDRIAPVIAAWLKSTGVAAAG